MARSVAAAGLVYRIMDATSLATCRMYRSGREAADGFAKNLFAAFGYAIIPYAFVWGWLGFVFLEPIVIWALHTALPTRVPINPVLLVVTVTLALVQWVFIFARLRLPTWPALLYPMTMTLFLAVAIRSFVDTARHRTRWKGRHVARPPMRWF